LIGEAHKGLKAMFTMMNTARLGVGMQGLGLAEVSWQNALAYAEDRLQMRALDGVKAPDKPADPIIVHPDVRRMLLTSKAFCEGARALSFWIGMNLDISHAHPDAKLRQEADDLVALMTPILKAYQTDMGFDVANLAIQVHGGHGYIREYGVEQYARDARNYADLRRNKWDSSPRSGWPQNECEYGPFAASIFPSGFKIY
jgi:alkylation response protein AidB-like acyl-CoA dehydrogenase